MKRHIQATDGDITLYWEFNEYQNRWNCYLVYEGNTITELEGWRASSLQSVLRKQVLFYHCEDTLNNVRRMFHLRGSESGRDWQIIRRVGRGEGGEPLYLARNVETNAAMVCLARQMSNLH
jgi:hypothetical protein